MNWGRWSSEGPTSKTGAEPGPGRRLERRGGDRVEARAERSSSSGSTSAISGPYRRLGFRLGDRLEGDGWAGVAGAAGWADGGDEGGHLLAAAGASPAAGRGEPRGGHVASCSAVGCRHAHGVPRWRRLGVGRAGGVGCRRGGGWTSAWWTSSVKADSSFAQSGHRVRRVTTTPGSRRSRSPRRG